MAATGLVTAHCTLQLFRLDKSFASVGSKVPIETYAKFGKDITRAIEEEAKQTMVIVNVTFSFAKFFQ
jgi:hypothetical protein